MVALLAGLGERSREVVTDGALTRPWPQKKLTRPPTVGSEPYASLMNAAISGQLRPRKG